MCNSSTEQATIDIAIPFNDVEFKSRSVGFIDKTFKGASIPCSQQIAAMARSIRKNWPQMSDRIYALHSEDLPDKSKAVLEESGVHVLHLPVEPRHGMKLLNKVTAYEDFSDADYTLQLDADMLFLKPPSFNLSCMAQAGYESNSIDLSADMWQSLYSHYDLEWHDMDNFTYKNYQETGKHGFMPCINNGAVLVKNSYKPTFREHVLDAEQVIADMGLLSNVNIKHFFMEIAASIAFHRTPDKEMFAPGINFIGNCGNNPYRIAYHEGVSLYHYVGGRNDEVNSLMTEYFA